MENKPIGISNHKQKGYGRQARLLLTMEYPPDKGGVGRYLESVVNALPLGNVEVRRAEFYRFFWPQWLKNIFIVFKYRPSELWVSHILPIGYIALIYKILTGRPYTIFIHGTDIKFATKNPWKKFLAKQILKNAKQIVINSKYTLSLLTNYKLQTTNYKLIYPCPTLKIPDQLPPKIPYQLLSVGRLVRRKGLAAGIKAAAKLKIEFPDLTYTIIGHGPEKNHLDQLIKKHSAQNYISLITDADDEALITAYAQSEILLVPGQEINNDIEGFGLVILEAAQFSVPSVATKVGGVGEAIIDGQTGILITNNEIETIASAVKKLLNDRVSLAQMGQAAKERVEREFDMKKQIHKLS